MPSLAEKVVELRLRRGWDRETLALRSGLHVSHIGQIERGLRKRLAFGTLQRLAHALGVTPESLMGEQPDETGDLAAYEQAIRVARLGGIEPDELLELVLVAGRLKRREGGTVHTEEAALAAGPRS